MQGYMATAVEGHESCGRPGAGALGCQAAGCVVLGGHLSPCQLLAAPGVHTGLLRARRTRGFCPTPPLLSESMASSCRGVSELVWVSARSRALVCPE